MSALGFKYISMILKGSEQTPIFVDSPFIIVSVVICICSPTFPVLGGISFLKTVNTLLSESTEGRTRHKGGRAFARTCIHHEVRSAEVPKAFFTCTQQVSRSMSM